MNVNGLEIKPLANLRLANLRGANLRLADLRLANLSGADLRLADLRLANLRGANLSGADLRGANLSGADLSGADLSGADLSGADLSGADLSGADLSGADLSGANLSGAKGLLNPMDYIKANFELIKDVNDAIVGFYAYKVFDGTYAPPEAWEIKEGTTISEIVNPLPTIDCACGVNVAKLEWVQREHVGKEIWKVSITGLQMLSVIVPYHTDGKIRVGECTLIEIV